MTSENKLLVLKIMNLSEAKANIDIVDSQFSKVRHLLDDIVGALASAGELDKETAEEYKKIDAEIFHVTKFIESMGFDIRSRRREVERNMLKIVEESEGC
jgi:Zn-dependent M32 family carboxypeptidase